MSQKLFNEILMLKERVAILEECVNALDVRTRKNPPGRPTSEARLPMTEVTRLAQRKKAS